MRYIYIILDFKREKMKLRQASTAALYFATGKLGLMMAMPPGLATPVWPPSGLALAAAAYWGPSVWPGIAAGSWLLNFLSLRPSGPARAAAVAAAVASGSTVQ